MIRPHFTALFVILLLCGCDSPPTGATAPPTDGVSASALAADLQRQQQRASNVTIIRDDFGVPHIYGKSDADAVFGLLYAQSEDDFPRVERNYSWAIGRLAEVEGEQALYSDLRAQLFMTEAEARAVYATAPDWLAELCQAWADGINYYLHTHPEVQPTLLTYFEPWMTMYFFEGSIGGDIEQIPLAGIQAFYDGSATPAMAWQPLVDDDEPRGSNGIAIAGELTQSGNTLLLINPHTSLYFRGEVHMVSEQGLNAYGAVTWGQFFIYQGFNEHTGWMHTSTRADFIDEFVQVIEERNGALMYRYGEQWLPLEVSEVTLKYRDGTRLGERTFPTYRTHHGPITHTTNGRWTATRINWDPVNALRQSYLRTKQADYRQFLAMMDIRTNSSNNTVYADSSGNIAYFHGNFIPRRDPRFDYSQPVDGSDPATDWQGRHTIDEMITLLNPASGWIQNANSSPFTAAGAHSPNPADYPAYMAPDAENYRAVHAVRALRQASDMTLEKLIALAYDPALPAFEVLIPGLVAAYEQFGHSGEDLHDAVALLRQWDHTVARDSVAMTLAHFYATNYLKQPGLPEQLSSMEMIQYLAQDSPPQQRLSVLADTLAQLQADFGQWATPWGEVNRFQRLSGSIAPVFDDRQPSLPVAMASGNWGALASYGTVRGESPAGLPNQRLYGVSGNSFVAVVEFGDTVRARSLLAGGQSGDPASPHFDDQAQRYADGVFKDVAFYRHDVERRAQRSYHPGEGDVHE